MDQRTAKAKCPCRGFPLRGMVKLGVSFLNCTSPQDMECLLLCLPQHTGGLTEPSSPSCDRPPRPSFSQTSQKFPHPCPLLLHSVGKQVDRQLEDVSSVPAMLGSEAVKSKSSRDRMAQPLLGDMWKQGLPCPRLPSLCALGLGVAKQYPPTGG